MPAHRHVRVWLVEGWLLPFHTQRGSGLQGGEFCIIISSSCYRRCHQQRAEAAGKKSLAARCFRRLSWCRRLRGVSSWLGTHHYIIAILLLITSFIVTTERLLLSIMVVELRKGHDVVQCSLQQRAMI